jgi:hypothetical protein
MQIFIFKKYISGEKGNGRTRMRVEIGLTEVSGRVLVLAHEFV